MWLITHLKKRFRYAELNAPSSMHRLTLAVTSSLAPIHGGRHGAKRRRRLEARERGDGYKGRQAAMACARGAMRVVSYVSAGAGGRADTQAGGVSAGAWRLARPFPTAGARVAADIRLRRRPDFNLVSV